MKRKVGYTTLVEAIRSSGLGIKQALVRNVENIYLERENQRANGDRAPRKHCS